MCSPVVTEDAAEVLFAVAEALSEANVTAEAEATTIVAEVTSVPVTSVAVVHAAVLSVVALSDTEIVANFTTVAAVNTHSVGTSE